MPDKYEIKAPGSLKYGELNQSHPSYCGDYLERLWALYEGGRSLLHNRQLMAEVFPRHRREDMDIYNERCKRAHYVGVPGEIVNILVSTIMSDPISVKTGDDGQLGAWYKQFVTDVTPKGGPTVPLTEFLRQAAVSMLVTRSAWCRVDMPEQGDYADRAAQEKAGALDAYVVDIPTSCLVDWEEEDDGKLKWALIYSADTPRNGLAGKRDQVLERWKYYDSNEWAVYEYAHKVGEEVKDDQVISAIKGGAHRFGVVPIVRKSVPKPMWAMNVLESLAREHFNKHSALAWGEFQSLLPELYEFLAREQGSAGVVIGAAQKNADRAVNQPRGQGYVQTRGNEDRAEFVGPPTAAFDSASKSCESLRDEMHRVLHLMALSVGATSSMLGRSAASKEQDQASTNIVAGEIGRHLKEYAVGIMDMVARGRGDVAIVGKWAADGACKFNSSSVDKVVERATLIESITIQSPTFHKMHQEKCAQEILEDRATPETMEKIHEELEVAITAESLQEVDKRESVDLGSKDMEDKGEDQDEGK